MKRWPWDYPMAILFIFNNNLLKNDKLLLTFSNYHAIFKLNKPAGVLKDCLPVQ